MVQAYPMRSDRKTVVPELAVHRSCTAGAQPPQLLIESPPMRLPTKPAALVSIAAAVAMVSGCDLQENADLSAGRDSFVQNCGTCHQLAEAATTAQIGPDLDAAFAASRAAGMDQDTIEGVVQAQIEVPREINKPADGKIDSAYTSVFMPANIVTGQEAEDVSAYIASVAGIPGIEPPTAPGGPGGQIYANNGCAACHVFGAAGSTGQVGPNLDEVLAGQSAKQINESIVDPNAVIAQGFGANIMPANYGEAIPAKDLKLLVKFLQQNAGKGK